LQVLRGFYWVCTSTGGSSPGGVLGCRPKGGYLRGYAHQPGGSSPRGYSLGVCPGGGNLQGVSPRGIDLRGNVLRVIVTQPNTQLVTQECHGGNLSRLHRYACLAKTA